MFEYYKIQKLIELYNTKREQYGYERNKKIDELYYELDRIFNIAKYMTFVREHQIKENTVKLKDKIACIQTDIELTKRILKPSYKGFKTIEQKQPIIRFLHELEQQEMIYDLEMLYWQLYCPSHPARQYHPNQGYFGRDFVCTICQYDTKYENIYKPNRKCMDNFSKKYMTLSNLLLSKIPNDLFKICIKY